MNYEEYVGRVRATAWRACSHSSPDRIEEVYRLIEHGAPAEGLCSLAWAIVDERVSVPGDLVEAINKDTAGIIDDNFMPTNLSALILPQGGR